MPTDPSAPAALVHLEKAVRAIERLTPTREHAEELVERVNQALAQARDFSDGKAILDTIASVEDLYRRQHAELIATNILAASRLNTTRLLGQYLVEHIAHDGGRPNGNGTEKPSNGSTVFSDAVPPTLSRLGVSRYESSRFQQIASVDSGDFEDLVSRGLHGELELTTRAVLNVYDETVGKRRREQTLTELSEDVPAQFDARDLTVYHGDARDLVSLGIRDVDLVFTSPPYNVDEEYYSHADDMGWGAYRQMMLAAYRACFAVMKPGARIGVVVPAGITIADGPYEPFAAHHAAWLQRARFNLLREVVWDKGEATVANRTSWGSWNSATHPNFRDRTERILFAYKGIRKISVPRGASLLNSDYFTRLTQDVWQVAPAHHDLHPAVFSPALVESAIRLLAFRGAHILDPFAGTGTVGKVALQLGCRASLVEADAAYCKIIQQKVRQ